MMCGSPPVRVFYRQDFFMDTRGESPKNDIVQMFENVSIEPAQEASPLKVNNASAKSGAGIKHAPSPAFLPQPPKHWMGGIDFEDQVLDVCIEKDTAGTALSSQLKLLLKVQG